MADKKISALTGASTPLTGVEVVPIVQSGATVKVAVSDLTAGRAVGALSYSATVPNNAAFQTAAAFSNATNADFLLRIKTGITDFGPSTATPLTVSIGLSEIGRWTAAGNWAPIAAKGIDYSANTPAAGMTSQLLNWYEEGTWTPTVTADAGTITSYTASGSYTRVGNVVELRFAVNVSNVGTASGALRIAGLPFTAVAYADTYPAGTFLVRETGLTGQVYQGFVNANSTQAFVAALSGAAINWTNDVVYVFSGTYRCA